MKPDVRAKSRLGLTFDQRRILARAFACDVVSTLQSCDAIAEVIVVGTPLPITVTMTVPDPGAGLNIALRIAVQAAKGPRVLAVLADLPCLRPSSVGDFLGVVDDSRVPHFVPDSAGIGTTMLAAHADMFAPHFGRRSRAAHRAAGFVETLIPQLPDLRRDVDSLVDLADAQRLGVGTFTHAALAELRLWS